MKKSALAISCDLDGMVGEFLLDEPNFAQYTSLGQHFTSLIDSGSRKKAQNFLNEILEKQTAVDWELVAALGPESRVLHFTGGIHNGAILVVGAESSADASNLIDDLMLVNNEQANALRRTVKESALSSAKNHPDLYDKLSAVNNELASLQRDLAKKNVQLERLSRQKDQLLGTAAHDLRNPLGAIKMYSQMMLGGLTGEPNEQQQKILEKIKKTSDFMLRVVEDTLDLSKIESGKVELRREPTNLFELLSSIVETNAMLAKEKSIQIHLQAEEQLPDIMLDSQKVEQVFNNLLSNAVKYSQSNTNVMVILTHQDDTVRIAVIDQGQGIPENELEKLFQPFAKISVKSTAGEKSTGLGLAIVKRLIEAHGGTIEVSSSPGKGSTFLVSLPARVGL